ncbi:MAG: hypothetical protein WED10_13380 [Brumimicrobium sp.]
MTLKEHVNALKNILDESCDNITSIEEINAHYSYSDEVPQGEGDSDIISCGQSENYNELEYIYRTKLLPFIKIGRITKEEAIIALCKVCRDLENPRNRRDFYDRLQDYLSVNID